MIGKILNLFKRQESLNITGKRNDDMKQFYTSTSKSANRQSKNKYLRILDKKDPSGNLKNQFVNDYAYVFYHYYDVILKHYNRSLQRRNSNTTVETSESDVNLINISDDTLSDSNHDGTQMYTSTLFQ